MPPVILPTVIAADMRLRRLSRLLFLKGKDLISPDYSFPQLPKDDEMSRCRCLHEIVGDVPQHLDGRVKDDVDVLTKLAANLLGISSAVADFLDESSLHFFAPHNSPTNEIPKVNTICAWHLIPCKPEILVLEDLRKDGRFRRAPPAGFGFNFCVGTPIVNNDGKVLGSVCVFDVAPRAFDANGCALLSNITDIVADSLDINCVDRPECGRVICDVRQDWLILFGDKRFREATGINYGQCFWDSFATLGTKQMDFETLLQHNSFKIVIKRADKSGDQNIYTATFWRATLPPATRKIPFCSAKGIYDLSHIYFASFERHRSTLGSSTQIRTLTNLSNQPPFDASISGLLGRGSFGLVYKGVYDGESVALKVFESGSSCAIPLEALIGQKALTAGHPNIVQTIRYETKKRTGWQEAWMVMELCENGSLLRWIDKGYFRSEASFYDGGPDVPLIVEAALQIANGLKCLHDSEILHGDLNCNNILVSTEFVAKLSDFGMSRVLSGDAFHDPDVEHGTISHMPREFIVDHIVSRSIDIYSFGVILYELYTSRRAYAGMRHPTIYTQKLLNRILPFPSNSLQEYRNLAESCMHNDWDQRPSIDDIISELLLIQSQVDINTSKKETFKVYD